MTKHALSKRRIIELASVLLTVSCVKNTEALNFPLQKTIATTRNQWNTFTRTSFQTQTRIFSIQTSTSFQPPESSSIKTGNILILDHLNINHEKGRHDLLNAFYFDFLQCKIDPRKMENYISKKKTVWANIGSQQFHLPEGKPNAQVLQGEITLAFESLEGFQERFEILKGLKIDDMKNSAGVLKDTLFDLEEVLMDDQTKSLRVIDPWGTTFNLVSDPALSCKDERGSQPRSEQDDPNRDNNNGLAMTDLTLYTPSNSNLQGIGRFYEQILGAPILSVTESKCVVRVGPHQTLTFQGRSLPGGQSIQHEDLVESEDKNEVYPSNYGPHISMYVQNIRSSYRKAKDLGVLYVNPRFKRRAYTEEEAVDQCMFRCLNIVDPENVEDGIILKVEHEVRSVLTESGSMYKSCPFDDIPDGCVI